MTRLLDGPLTRALVVENPHHSLDQLLARDGVEVRRIAGAAPGEDALVGHLLEHRSQVLFKRSRVQVTRRVIEACPDLMAVQLCCIGSDSVDLQACADQGVMVFNDPVSNGRSVVELAVAHLVALSRRLYETDSACRSGVWEKSASERYEIQGKVLGVLGLGKIGRQTARAAEALGMKVIFYDSAELAREVGVELGWEAMDTMEALFSRADCVTVHLSSQDHRGRSNEGVITRALLGSLGRERPSGSPRIFLNLSRGFLHSAEDLLAAVEAGEVRRAAVDVFPHEPRGDEAWANPYAAEPRVAVTPHIGASTEEAQPRIAQRVAQTFRAFSRLGRVRDCVFASRLELALGEPGRVVLAVCHATARGTKAAIDEAIFEAGASNLASVHRDFEKLGVAYDLASLDAPLGAPGFEAMVYRARLHTGRPDAIRSIRQVVVA